MSGIKGTAIRCASWVVLAAMIAAIGTGCAAKVNRDVLMNTKKVGILSITISKLGTQATDDEVMQNTVNYTARLYADALSKRPEPKSFMEKIQQINENLEASFNTENLVKTDSARYLGASGMPIIPYSYLEKLIGKKQPEQPIKPKDMNGIKLDLARKIGELAGKLNLDGLLVIYLRTGIYSSAGSDINVMWGERALDTVRMEPTLVLVSRDGRAAIDLGYPVIGHGSTKNAGMPIYKVEGHRGASLRIGGSKSHKPDEPKFPIDLKDPGGKVQRDLYALADLALKDFSKKLDKELENK